MAKTLSVAVTIAVTLIAINGFSFAQEKKQSASAATQPVITVQVKEVEGTIAGLSGSFIAVLYGRSEKGVAQEMAFTLNDKVRIVHKNSLKEINVGDTVKIVYEETVEKKGDGSQSYKRAVKQIVFLQQAPKQIKPEEEFKSRTEEPSQAAEPRESIPLKGLKGD